MEKRVLYEDNHLLVFNKLPGEIVQGDKTGDTPLVDSLKLYLKTKYNKPGNVFLGLTHRLDRPTSGIVVFAKTSKALSRLTVMFQKRELEKVYWAIVDKKPNPIEQRLENYLIKNEKQNKSYVVNQDRKGSKRAVLDYKFLMSSDQYHLLKVKLETGRHHQIRAQLSSTGLRIKGDVKYGFKRPNKDGSIHLHAREIGFTHPVSKDFINIIASTPTDAVWDFFESNYSS